MRLIFIYVRRVGISQDSKPSVLNVSSTGRQYLSPTPLFSFESNRCFATKEPGFPDSFRRCAGLDSNQRRPKSGDLQSPLVDHLSTDANSGSATSLAPFSSFLNLKRRLWLDAILSLVRSLRHRKRTHYPSG